MSKAEKHDVLSFNDVFTAVVIQALLPAAGSIPEPEGTFEIAGSNIRIGVRRSDGSPATNVRVRLYDRQLRQLGDTRTDHTGCAVVPVPKTETCQVIIDLDSQPSNPIPLAILPGPALVPKSAAVTFGMRPCCRVPYFPRGFAAPDEASNSTWFGLAGMAAVVVAWCGWVWRRRLTPAASSKERLK